MEFSKLFYFEMFNFIWHCERTKFHKKIEKHAKAFNRRLLHDLRFF